MPSSAPLSPQRYRFDDLTLDVGQRRLWRGEEAIPITRLSFGLLRVLVEQAPNLVAHGELAEKAWGPHRYVTPESVSQRIKMLRKVLGDEAARPRYIESVRGQGYRLIPEVETDLADLRAPDSDGVPHGFHAPATALAIVDRDGSRTDPSNVEQRAPSKRLPWLTALALGLVAASIGIAWLRSPDAPASLLQSALVAPNDLTLEVDAGFALSSDGRMLAFIARDGDGVRKLWVRPLAERDARPLAGTEGVMTVAPFWSPDGRDIGFFADQALKRVAVAGGMVQALAAPTLEPKGGTWSRDGRIVYAPDYRTGLFVVAASGGTPEALTTLDAARGELSHRWPQFLPDGQSVLFLVQTAEAGAQGDRSRIEVLEASRRHEILGANSSAVYAHPGRLLFWRDGAILAQELDLKQRRLRGEARRVADGVALTLSEWATFAVSDEGTLVYTSALPWRLEWRERSGRLHSVAVPEGRYSYAALSPDGQRIVYVDDNLTVWIRDLDRGTDMRLTFDDVDHYSPVWSPDGEWLAYSANASDNRGSELRRHHSSAIGEAQVLHSSHKVIRHASWSPDGRWIAFDDGDDIFFLDVESRRVQPRVVGQGADGYPQFSPDGRWLAYSSDESGRDEVYLEPAFGGSARWQVSNRGGFEPRWGSAGGELLFVGFDGELSVAKVELGETPQLGLPEPLFPLPAAKPETVYDVAPDGMVLVRAALPEDDASAFRLVVNWPRLLDEPTP
jgi:Tol biopolymer transport system component/DNA-binding winged helix-turn-helix (wHTH) protein